MKPQAQVEYRAIADLKELPGNPHYADVIIERWEKFTGRKAERIKAVG